MAQLNPYLAFRDNTRQAMEFYKSVFGGVLEMHTFKEFHASQDPSEDDKIMHSMLTADDVVFMAADTPNGMDYKPGNSMSMSLSGKDEARLREIFEKLSEGGEVRAPLEKSAWGDTFGMVTDKFGTQWMVNIFGPKGDN